jgi:hypothetical protein
MWEIHPQTPGVGDINWQSFGTRSDELFHVIYSYLLNISIAVITTFFITPMTILMNNLKPFMGYINKENEANGVHFADTAVNMVNNKLGVMALIIYNSLFIPNLVTQTGYQIKYGTSHELHKGNYKRYIFYLFTNTVILNLMTANTIKDLIKIDKDPQKNVSWLLDIYK